MKKTIFILFLLMVCKAELHAQMNENIFQMLRSSFKDLIQNCTMEYTADCIYPDNTKLSVKGLMAMRDQNYYDSSNTRLLFKNDRWLINYDHLNSTANVLNLAQWKKEYGSLGRLYISEYLESDSLFLKNAGVSIEGKKDGKMWLVFKFSPKVTTLKSLKIQYAENSLVPIQYQGEMLCAMDYSTENFIGEDVSATETPSEFITVKFSCFNITRGTQDMYFDDSRFVEYNNKGAFLKKYKNYKLSKS